MSDPDHILARTQWSFALLRIAFRDLATSFGAIDPASAKRALDTIEASIGLSLLKLAQDLEEGIAGEEYRTAAQPFRDLLEDCRGHVQQVSKPKH